MIEAFTTSCRPFSSANSAMISSGALPNVTFSRPPMPGPGAVRELLGRPAHQRRGRHHAERGGEEDDDRGRRPSWSSTIATAMNGTSRYGQPCPLSRNCRRLVFEALASLTAAEHTDRGAMRGA